MIKIKICGLFRGEDALAVNAAVPDFVGFVFVKGRRRYCSPVLAGELRKKIAPEILSVGVFQDEDAEGIEELYARGIISFAQLHGGESAEYVAALKKRCPRLSVIKALCADGETGGLMSAVTRTVQADGLKQTNAASALNEFLREQAALYVRAGADFLLFDSGSGGTGRAFDRSVLRGIDSPFFIAGGINSDNIEAVLSFKPYAVDISGGAETDGLKDAEKIIKLTETVRGSK
ncbi:MAG: phosphoribosylanthranilate isomerase [Clostridiales bacterium]|jgi:phosphoribosylanthranilate isomerase|nr:phosphoribosylanthranilate isomerase [Clostridiales bacterium]